MNIRQAAVYLWTQFFAGSTSAARKQALLQNGRSFAALLSAQSGSPLARSTTATVARVRVVPADVAQVTYTILLAGKPALTDQVGTAVRVSSSSSCQLLNMAGQKVAACTNVSATTSS